MFIDGYDKICKTKGLSPTSVLKEIGISKGVYTNWKSTGAEPLNSTKKKIADYFGISIAELESGEMRKEAPALAGANDEMNDMLEEIRRRPELKALFSLSSKATTDDINTAIKIIEALKGGHSDE